MSRAPPPPRLRTQRSRGPAAAARLGLGRCSSSASALALPVHHRPAHLRPDDLLDASIETLAYMIMALGPEHRRRLRRPARPRLRRVLRDRRVRHGLARLAAVPDVAGGDGIHILTPRQFAARQRVPGIHINFFLVIFIAGGVHRAVGRRSSARRRCACAATTWRSSRSPSARSCRASSRTRRAASSASARPTSPTAARASRRSTRSTLPWTTTPLHVPARARTDLLRRPGDGRCSSIFLNIRLRDSRLGPRVDRRARGRGRGGGDGRQPRAHEALGLRASARRSAASPARSSATYKNTVNVDQFEFGFSVFILCHGHHRRDGQHLGRRSSARSCCR